MILTGGEGFSDYELTELLLFLTPTRRKSALATQDVLRSFGNFYNLLTATPAALYQYGMSVLDVELFDIIHEASRRLSRAETMTRPQLSNTASVTYYLDVPHRLQRPNGLVALLLNSSNHLLKEDCFSEDCPTEEIIATIAKSLIDANASSLILVTFRNSYFIEPIPSDNSITQRVMEVTGILSVEFHDHLVFTIKGLYSFRAKRMTYRSYEIPTMEAADAFRETDGLSQESFQSQSRANLLRAFPGFSEEGSFEDIAVQERYLDHYPIKSLVTGSHKLCMLSDVELMIALFQRVSQVNDEVVNRLIAETGSFASVLALPSFELGRHGKYAGLVKHEIVAIKLTYAAAVRIFRSAAMNQPSLKNDYEALTKYITVVLARESVEHFRILFLDETGRLQVDEAESRGTVNHAAIYPREIARRALQLKSKFLILVHNHPSGNPSPSSNDLSETHRIEDAVRLFGIKVWDHIIVGNGSWFSLRREGMLKFTDFE